MLKRTMETYDRNEKQSGNQSVATANNLVPPQGYDFIEELGSGLFRIGKGKTEKEMLYGIGTTESLQEGKLVAPCEYDVFNKLGTGVYQMGRISRDGEFTFQGKSYPAKCIVAVENVRNGRIVIPFEHTNIQELSSGVFSVKRKAGKKLVNGTVIPTFLIGIATLDSIREGQLILPCKYESIYRLSYQVDTGIFLFIDENNHKGYTTLDGIQRGEWVVPYEKNWWIREFSSNPGVFRVEGRSGTIGIATVESLHEGRVAISCDYIQELEKEFGFLGVKCKKLYGIATIEGLLKGEWIIPCQLEYIRTLNKEIDAQFIEKEIDGGFIEVVNSEGRAGYATIDSLRKGELVLPCEYRRLPSEYTSMKELESGSGVFLVGKGKTKGVMLYGFATEESLRKGRMVIDCYYKKIQRLDYGIYKIARHWIQEQENQAGDIEETLNKSNCIEIVTIESLRKGESVGTAYSSVYELESGSGVFKLENYISNLNYCDHIATLDSFRKGEFILGYIDKITKLDSGVYKLMTELIVYKKAKYEDGIKVWGLATIESFQKGKYIPCDYLEVNELCPGVFELKDDQAAGIATIDSIREGELALPCEYTIESVYPENKEELKLVLIADKKGKKGVFDIRANNIVIPCEYNNIEIDAALNCKVFKKGWFKTKVDTIQL